MELNSVVPWGRTLSEYREIFSLHSSDLEASILGCGDGPASFNAELTQRGGKIVSIDPTYQFDAESLKSRISEVYDEVIPQITKNREKYVWDNIKSVDELIQVRMSAMNIFISDYEVGRHSGRYIYEYLPKLSFYDKQFDLALCSHYLFLYSDHVNLEEHIASVKELSRVATEVRIYPLLSLDGNKSPHLDEVISSLRALGLKVFLENVNYEFQKGATQMLVIKTV